MYFRLNPQPLIAALAINTREQQNTPSPANFQPYSIL